MSRDDLYDVLTPWLFRHLVINQFPWPPATTSMAQIKSALENRQNQIGNGAAAVAEAEKLTKAQLVALKAISKTPLDKIHAHDLFKYLPSSESPEFLEQSLGLLLLLDQSPRGLKGRDERYVHSYFSIVGEHFSEHLLRLPDGHRPDKVQQWMDQGYSYTEAVRRCIWFIIPLVHSENLENHQFCNDYVEKLRVEMEKRSGQNDPYRARKDEMNDETAFKKVATEGPPKGDDVTVEQHMFWFFHLLDVHIPIIRKYGRYPYRNNMDGRADTEEEIEFMKRTENFGKEDITKEEEDAIRKDVMDGIWSPLDGTGFKR